MEPHGSELGSTSDEVATEPPPVPGLRADAARDKLFNTILDQLDRSGRFSGSTTAPSIFVIYAHNNEQVGAANDGHVRDIIKWLEDIHCEVLSDRKPLPLGLPRNEGNAAIRNIFANQICILPPDNNTTTTTTHTSVGKVILCGSQVLRKYYEDQFTAQYIQAIIEACNAEGPQSTTQTAAEIQKIVDAESTRDGFHHVLTELAFLSFRKYRLLEDHGIIPVALDGELMHWLPILGSTDIVLKLKSQTTTALHRLFFKILEQLFPDEIDFIKQFQKCYDLVSDEHGLENSPTRSVSSRDFEKSLNERISYAHGTYRNLACVVAREGKLRAYTGNLGDQITQVLEEIDKTIRRDILRWLSSVPASEQHGEYKSRAEGRLEGTCEWIINHEEFHGWHNCEGSAILSLHGQMGTGKTYASSKVIDWIDDRLSTTNIDEAFAYFYCNKQDRTRSDPTEIVRNIVRQLATGPWKRRYDQTTVQKVVRELWEKSQGQGINSTFGEWQDILLRLLDTYPRTTIVLDALDECNKGSRQDLIDLFTSLAKRPRQSKPVKVFIATRPEADVIEHLGHYPKILMRQEHNGGDIERFIYTKIGQHSKWKKMPGLRNEITRKLLAKSDGMFLFASLQVDSLLECQLESTMRNRLVTLPRTLKETYKEIYKGATKEDDERKLMNKALQWVMCSQKPLTTDELRFFICQDADSDGITETQWDVDKTTLLALCHNLLVIDTLEGGLEVWRLAHQAVAEFLNDTCCNLDSAHCQAAKICLTVVIDSFGRCCQISSEERTMLACPCSPQVREASEDVVLHDHFREDSLEYANYAWPTHVRAYEPHNAGRIDERFMELLLQFFGHPEHGSLIYQGWLRHNIGEWKKYWHLYPEWSIFRDRLMPEKSPDLFMPPIMLAVHLGICRILHHWSDNSDYDTNYVSAFSWRINWSPVNKLNRWGKIGTMKWSLLALAVIHGETRIWRHLLQRGAEVIPRVEDEVPPLFAAAKANLIEAAEQLLQRGANIRGPDGVDPLGTAIDQDSLPMVHLMLKTVDGDPGREVENCLEEPWLKPRVHSDDMFQFLLVRLGINVARSGDLLGQAVEDGRKTWVHSLLDAGIDVNKSLLQYGGHALGTAVAAKKVSMARLLLEKGAKIDTPLQDWWGTEDLSGSVVGFACTYYLKRPGMLRLLLEHSPDLNMTWPEHPDWSYCSALATAVSVGDVALVQLLIKKGADVNSCFGGPYGNALNAVFWRTIVDVDYHGIIVHSRLYAYAKPYPTDAMLKSLRDAGASLDGLDGEHLDTALAAAAHAGLGELVEELLGRGADPNACCKGSIYGTAVGAAAASPHSQSPRILSMLMNEGADVNIDFPIDDIYDLEEFEDFHWLRYHDVALDIPFYLVLVGPSRLCDIWLQAASTMLSHGALWDVDFEEWRKCLRKRDTEFASDKSEVLDDLGRRLEENRSKYFSEDYGSTLDDRWTIKSVVEDGKSSRREVI